MTTGKFGKKALGYRNKNPGNIELGDSWYGRVPDNEQTDRRFIQFKTHEWGISAAAVLLRVYQNRHGLNTIEGIIKRWAPANENDTKAYIRRVSQMTGIDRNETLNMNEYSDLFPILKAIISVELGVNPYSDETINRGLTKVRTRGSNENIELFVPNIYSITRTEQQQQKRENGTRAVTFGAAGLTVAEGVRVAADIKHNLYTFGLLGGALIVLAIICFVFWDDIKEFKDSVINRVGPV